MSSEQARSIREEREKKIRMLYEEYIHLAPVQATWNSPLTENPRMEPCFTAGMQGVELAFLLMAHFLGDERTYVVKRPRIERVAQDIQNQYRLIAEVIDGELEDENVAQSPLGTLTQAFPFEGSPPTKQDRQGDKARQSEALDLVINAIRKLLPSLRPQERQSLKRIMRNISGTFETCFREWTVGVGVEEQLSELRQLVGLQPLAEPFGRKYLDYVALVRPKVICETLTKVNYRHNEDFFFRSIHLGTECWCFVALHRIQAAVHQVEKYKHWENAAAHIRSAAHIFDYLGEHVMMLTSMVLRDYLHLKVEIEGTSGAGSAAVKLLRKQTEQLFVPLVTSLTKKMNKDETPVEEDDLKELLLELYEHPEKFPGMYNYAKALETVESGLLGGFFFRHFCLASNVIGSDAKGTMKMAVKALKKTYERPVFPVLDFVRAELGRRMDEKYIHRKGKIMNEIEEKRSRSRESSMESFDELETFRRFATNLKREGDVTPFEAIRSKLFDTQGVPEVFKQAEIVELDVSGDCSGTSVAFLDHAWGKTPPAALSAATLKQYALYSIGNSTWGKMFQDYIPEASGHVRRVLKADPNTVVEFGHNSHELVSRMLSVKVEALVEGKLDKLRVLTTDTEFYSFTRQLNRLKESKRVHVDVVAIHPVETFEERFLQAAQSSTFDVFYVSQSVFLTQETLLADVAAFGHNLHQISAKGQDLDAWKQDTARMPFIFIDGYHGFGAIPTTVGTLDINVFYVSGVLKHVASGANMGFMLLPPGIDFRPLFTGWLADPSVLSADSPGIAVGSQVGYCEGLRLMGGTPSFLPSLIVFLEVMRRWQEQDITVEAVHDHVMRLHEEFLAHLPSEGLLSTASLLGPRPEPIRSHTLSFDVGSPAMAKMVVEFLHENFNVEVDSRKSFVRIGFGLNHSMVDVKLLNKAVSGVANAKRLGSSP